MPYKPCEQHFEWMNRENATVGSANRNEGRKRTSGQRNDSSEFLYHSSRLNTHINDVSE